MTTKILCIGDIHIGRIPGHIPADFGGVSVSVDALGPVEAWHRSVAKAVALGVDAVVMTGDLVDGRHMFFEALGPLEDGLHRLDAAGTPVYAVAGNHDGEVLPRLAEHLPHLLLLGEGGEWEFADLPGGAARIAGWSFGADRVSTSPLATLASSTYADSNAPIIGLLHCDYGAAHGNYAPVAASELANPSIAAWLLGHIHQPGDLASMARPVGYLGSLTPLDPTETGTRGPWLMTIDGGRIEMRHLALAPLRWEALKVSVAGLDSVDDFEGFLAEAVRARTVALLPALGEASVVGYRIRLVGRTKAHAALSAKCAELGSRLTRTVEDVRCFVDRIDASETMPAIDMARLAEGADPPAVLARRIIDIEQRNAAGLALIRSAIPRLQSEAWQDRWKYIERREFGDDDAARILIKAGYRALDDLLAQRPEMLASMQDGVAS